MIAFSCIDPPTIGQWDLFAEWGAVVCLTPQSGREILLCGVACSFFRSMSTC